jgi:endoglucanase
MMIKEYTDAFGVSGCEGEIRKIIKNRVYDKGETSIDNMGNLLVHKEGKGPKVMVSAHMDEVGFIVNGIKDDGRITFSPVGGIDTRILISKRVIFKNKNIVGVIGSKPIHLQTQKEAESPLPLKDLFIDIGAESKKQAEKYVSIGDYAVFESEYVDMGRCIKAKALDDRVGCAILTKVLEEDFGIDLYGAFTVQEETGLRGAGVAAYKIRPKVALVLEGTTCADTTEDEKDYVSSLGLGPVLSPMDGASMANEKLLKHIIGVAEKNNIPYQFKKGRSGGNDAGIIHKTGEGVMTASISVPVRYIHSPISIMAKEDYENTLKLVELVLKSLEEVI